VKAVIAGVLVRHAQVVAERKVTREAAAATTIQAQWRAHLASAAYNKQLQAIRQLQAAIRCRSQRRSFLAQKAAAVLIQSRTRAYLTRLQQHRSHAAASRIQAYWRGYLAQTRCDVIIIIMSSRNCIAGHMGLDNRVIVVLNQCMIQPCLYKARDACCWWPIVSAMMTCGNFAYRITSTSI
jgi:hypothetical protein